MTSWSRSIHLANEVCGREAGDARTHPFNLTSDITQRRLSPARSSALLSPSSGEPTAGHSSPELRRRALRLLVAAVRLNPWPEIGRLVAGSLSTPLAGGSRGFSFNDLDTGSLPCERAPITEATKHVRGHRRLDLQWIAIM